MSSTIQRAFETSKQRKKCAFIPFITGGFPNTDAFIRILRALDDSGADIIEVGVPFSDPLADGPVIQHSSKLALDSGVTPRSILEILESVKGSIRAPIVVMSYWNPIKKMGSAQFASSLRDAGVSGVIVPDLSPEESDDWRSHATNNDVDTIFMVAPTTSSDRIKKIISCSSGFVYIVSMTGVTGSSLEINTQLETLVGLAKSLTDLPVAVGFGVSTPEQAASLSRFADGVIVGSALVRTCLEAKSEADAINSVKGLATRIASALEHH